MRIFNKIVSFCTLTAFFFVNLSPIPISAMEIAVPSGSHSIIIPDVSNLITFNDIIKELSYDDVDVNMTRFNSLNAPVLIHIGDAHASPSAQNKIADILKNISEKFNDKGKVLIFLEGSCGAVNCGMLKSIPDKFLRSRIASYLLNKNVLSSAEFEAVTSDLDVELYGVEDKEVYFQELAAFRKALVWCDFENELRKKLEFIIARKIAGDPYLVEINAVLSGADKKIQRSLFNTNFLRIIKALSEQYKEDRDVSDADFFRSFKSLGSWLELKASMEDLAVCGFNEGLVLPEEIREEAEDFFRKAMQYPSFYAPEKIKYYHDRIMPLFQKEAEPDFSVILQFISFYRRGPLAGEDYPLLTKLLRVFEKLAAIDFLCFKTDLVLLTAMLAETEKGPKQEAMRLIAGKYFLSQLFKFRITSREFTFFSAAIKTFMDEFMSRTPDLCIRKAREGLDAMVRFYDIARVRDKVIARNTAREIEKRGADIAFLVTGGFHTDGVFEILKKRGISTISVIPKFKGKDFSREVYVKSILDPFSTLEKESVSMKEHPGAELNTSEIFAKPTWLYGFHRERDIADSWTQYVLARTIASANIVSSMVKMRQAGKIVTQRELEIIRNEWILNYDAYLNLYIEEFPGEDYKEKTNEKRKAIDYFQELLTYIFSDLHEESRTLINQTASEQFDYDFSIKIEYGDGTVTIYPMRDEHSPDRFIELRLNDKSKITLFSLDKKKPGIPLKRSFTFNQTEKLAPQKIKYNEDAIKTYQTNPLVTTPVIFHNEKKEIVFIKKEGKLFLPERYAEAGESFTDAVENTIYGISKNTFINDVNFIDIASDPGRVKNCCKYSFVGYAAGTGFNPAGAEALSSENINMKKIAPEHRNIVKNFIAKKDVLDKSSRDYCYRAKEIKARKKKTIGSRKQRVTYERHLKLIEQGNVQPMVAPDFIVETYDDTGNFKGILLIKREQDNHWATPGGFARGFESIEETGLREVLEETGIKQPRIKRVLRLGSDPSRDERAYIWSPLFLAEIRDDQVPVPGQGEVQEVIKIKTWEEVEYLFKRKNQKGGLWADHLEHLKTYFDYRKQLEAESFLAGETTQRKSLKKIQGTLNYFGDTLIHSEAKHPGSVVEHEVRGHINTASIMQEVPKALDVMVRTFNGKPHVLPIPKPLVELRYRNLNADDETKHKLLSTELSKQELVALKRQYTNIIGGFAGFVPGGINPEDKSKIRGIFKKYIEENGFSPEDTLIVSGGTKTEGIEHFYEVAKEVGFKTVNIMPGIVMEPDETKKSSKYKIIDADYVYIEERVSGSKYRDAQKMEVPGGWGSETDIFNEFLTELFVFGGGGRIKEVVGDSLALGKKVSLIKGIHNVKGEICENHTENIIEKSKENGGKIYEIDEENRAFTIKNELDLIPSNLITQRYFRGHSLKKELSKQEFFGLKKQYKHIIAEGTFAGKGIYEEDREKLKEVLRTYLDQFSRNDILILSGGTTVGGLNVFVETARELGFKTAGTVPAIALDPEFRNSLDIWDVDYLYIEQDEPGYIDESERTRAGGWGSDTSMVVNLANEIITFGGYDNTVHKVKEIFRSGGRQITVIKGVRNRFGDLGAADENQFIKEIIAKPNVKVLDINKPIIPQQAKQGIEREKVIFATDIGFDPQSFLALEFILTHPEKYELMGVVTAYSPQDLEKVDYELKAKIAKKMLITHGYENVPVFSYFKKNKVKRNRKDPIQDFHYDMAGIYLSNEELEASGVSMGIRNNSIEFMEQVINENEKDISIISVGPLTPIAKVLERDAAIARKVKQFILMGGAYNPDGKSVGRGFSGYNFRVDIPSAEKVLTSDAKIILVGTDSTRQVRLDQEYIDQFVKKGTTLFSEKYAKMTAAWQKCFSEENTFAKGLYVQDVLAAAYLMYPDAVQPVILELKKGVREFMGDKNSPALFMRTLPVPEIMSNTSIVTRMDPLKNESLLEDLACTVFNEENFKSGLMKRKERLYRNFFKIRINPLLDNAHEINQIDKWSFDELISKLSRIETWGRRVKNQYYLNETNVFNEMIALWTEYTRIDPVTFETIFNTDALKNVSDKSLYTFMEEFQKDFDLFVSRHRDFFVQNGYFDDLSEILKKDVKGVSEVFICYKRELESFIRERLESDEGLSREEITEMFETDLMQDTGMSLDDIRHRIFIEQDQTKKILEKVAQDLDAKRKTFTDELFEAINDEFEEISIKEEEGDGLGHELYHDLVLADEENAGKNNFAALEVLAKQANKQKKGKIDRKQAIKEIAERIKKNKKLRRKLNKVSVDKLINLMEKQNVADAFESLIKRFEIYTVVKNPKKQDTAGKKAQQKEKKTPAKRKTVVTRQQKKPGGVNYSPNMQDTDEPETGDEGGSSGEEEEEEIPFFDDFTAQAEKGELNPCYYRDAQITELVKILNRGQNCNPMLLGPAGVGKTNMVEGLAIDIANKETGSSWINSMRILSLNLASFYAYSDQAGAGASIGAFLKKAKDSNTIVFIDEFHALAPDKSQNELNQQFFQFIKPALSRGEIRVIATTTDKEFKEYVEGDEAFERRFGTLILESMIVPDAIDTMIAIKD
ncbi:MAG: nucleoside hydrolase [Candidatus Omnitrophota bacterium]